MSKEQIDPAQIVQRLLDPDSAKKEEERKAELAKREEAKKKELEKKNKIKPKYYYDVKVECLLPATLTYRILAEDAVQAASLIKGKQPVSVQHKLVGRKELQLKVYDSGSAMIRFMKKLVGF